MTPYLLFFLAVRVCKYVLVCLLWAYYGRLRWYQSTIVRIVFGWRYILDTQPYTHAHTESEKGRKRYENQSGHHGYISIAGHKLCQKKIRRRRTIQQHDIRILSTQCPCFIIYAATHYKYTPKWKEAVDEFYHTHSLTLQKKVPPKANKLLNFWCEWSMWSTINLNVTFNKHCIPGCFTLN